jgi:membrane protein required for colicin V production
MHETLNTIDISVISLALIFVVTAFFRGFIKEIFSIFNWTISLTLSHLLAPYATEYLQSFYDNKFFLDITVRTVLFIIVFLAVMFSTSGLRDSLKEKISKALDRSLGVFFAILKTLAICGITYSMALHMMKYALGDNAKTSEAQKKMPAVVKEARTRPILEFSGSIMDPIVESFFNSVAKNFDQVLPKTSDLDSKLDELSKEETTPETADDVDSGYNKKDIEKMNRLIEVVQ